MMFDMETGNKIVIELVDTDRFRNHQGASHLILDDNFILHEAISVCDWYNLDDYGIPPIKRDYYIRTKYKRKKINGAHFSSVYQQELGMMLYFLQISLEGSTDDIEIKYNNRKEGHEVYKKVTNWIFNNDIK